MSVPASRTNFTGATPNDLPPLSFHRVHGKDVRLSEDGSTARIVGDTYRLVFSARPVSINERVCIRFVEISKNHWGYHVFGFTNFDPAKLSYCPNVYCLSRSGTKFANLEERFCENGNIFYYYANSAGDVHFGINGEDKGILFTGVNTRSPLWSLVQVHKYGATIQYVDPGALNLIGRSLPSPLPEDNERLVGSLTFLSIDDSLPPLRFQSQAVVPLTLHRTKGRNVQYLSDIGVAARDEAEICQGYVFTASPIRPGQTLVVQILASDPAYPGSLAFGLTSCDPATLRPSDLPDDAEQLVDRPEYWVVARRDDSNGLRRGDELNVTLTLDGEVSLSKNGSNPLTTMHVDHTVRLWAFVDIFGATQKVRMLSLDFPERAQTPPWPQQSLTGSAAPIYTGAGSQQPCVQDLTTQPSSTCIQAPPYQQPAPVQRPRNDAQSSSSQNSQNGQVVLPNIVTNEHSDPPLRLVNERRTNDQSNTECTICCENPIDSVLYTCGHMCMCYVCAFEQWQGQGSGECPLCRATIRDVIRTYKS